MKERLLFLLLLLPLAWVEGPPSDGDCLQNPIIGFEGNDTVVSVPEVIGTPTHITWKKGENIVHEWDGNSDPSNGKLIIKNVSHSDVGLYTAEIEIGTKIEYSYFCLKILEYLVPPVLNCSDHSDDIQVNCTSPPQIYSLNLPVSYHWEHMGKDPGLQSIKLRKNENLPEKITCTIHIYNVHASSSIALTDCLSKKPDQGRSQQGLIGVLVFGVLAMVLLVFGWWKKDHITRWLNTRKRKRQKDPGNGEDVTLTETPDDSKCILQNSKDDRREGNGEDVPLTETPDDSECVLQNSKDDRTEGNSTTGKA